MKLLRIIASLDPQKGGPIEVIRSTALVHASSGHQTDVLNMDSPESRYLDETSFNSIPLGPGKWKWAYSSKLRHWLYHNFSHYDVVIVDGLWLYPSFAVSRVIQQMRKRGEKTPLLIVYPHGMLDPWFQSWSRRPLKTIRNILYWNLFEKHVVETADIMLFTSETEKQLARSTFRNYRPRKEQVLSIGCQPPPPFTINMKAAFREKCPELDNERYLLFLSRLDPKKGVDLLIRAYLEVAGEYELKHLSFPHLVIAGPDPESDYGKTLLKLASPREAHIHFTGMIRGDEKWGAFYGCDSFILPSHQENFGIAVTEALGCGKHVFISKEVNIFREIESSGAGTSAADDLDGIIWLIRQAIEHSQNDISIESSQKAMECFHRFFDISITSQSLIELVREQKDR